VAEGIETSLAVTAMHSIGCWAAVSAHGLQSFQWPAEVKNLYVMGDNDSSNTGQMAAERLAKEAASKGLTARVHIPETVGQDWADVLMDRARQPA
jgi:putative DNA primase/helicase